MYQYMNDQNQIVNERMGKNTHKTRQNKRT